MQLATLFRRAESAPLYAAGFVTAFGAHSIAAGLGGYLHTERASLLALGVLLAVYDIAEVLLKPVFGGLADRIGPRPVLLGGLIGFALASAAFVLVGTPATVGVVRFAQGAAAAAFSPAAAAMLARIAPPARHGRAFGSYGAWKGLGYALGPLLGGVLVVLGGFALLFAVLAVLAVVVASWARLAVPRVVPLPRSRQTVLDLVRRLTRPDFLRPTTALAAAAGALAVGVGFLPVQGVAAGLRPLATGTAISVLATTAALVQPWTGRAHDAGRLGAGTGIAVGLLLAAAGFALTAAVPGIAGLLGAVLMIGVGTGLVTPLGFTVLASSTRPERLGQTMGSAEVGREIGDAGGPLLVGTIAAASSVTGGLLGMAALLAASAVTLVRTGSKRSSGSRTPGRRSHPSSDAGEGGCG